MVEFEVQGLFAFKHLANQQKTRSSAPTIATIHLTQQNVQTPDPVNPNITLQAVNNAAAALSATALTTSPPAGIC